MDELGSVKQVCAICLLPSPLFLLLRNCSHSVCLPCLHFHLKFWILRRQKARIKCPFTSCVERVHENDIRAVLDPDQELLDVITPADQRSALQYHHDKHVITYALGGEDRIRRCPLCKAIYSETRGCHLVMCANTRCRSQFCWVCGHPVKSLNHFAGSFCRIGYDDLYRGVYILRFISSTSLPVLIALLPWVLTLFFFLFPLSIMFALPIAFSIRIYKSATDRSNLLLPEEYFMMITKMVLVCILTLPLSIILVPSSFVTSLYLTLLYAAICYLKTYIDRLEGVIDRLFCFLACFGMEDWKQMLRDSHESKEKKATADEQRNEEASERRQPVHPPPSPLPDPHTPSL